jgi:hypothetical protein
MKLALSVLSLAFTLLLAACDEAAQMHGTAQKVIDLPHSAADPAAAAAGQSAEAEVRVLNWDNLLPDDFRPDRLMQDYDVENLSDDDPRAKELMQRLQAMWKEAPVVAALNGQTVKLPGFVVPLEGDGQVVNEFLLVPYYGACIHVPPPPANQIVYVRAQGRNVQVRRLYDTVWVTGVMQVEHTESELGAAGYTLNALEVIPYEDPQA